MGIAEGIILFSFENFFGCSACHECILNTDIQKFFDLLWLILKAMPQDTLCIA